MAETTSHEAFIRAVGERTNVFRESMRQLILAIAQTEKGQKVEALKSAAQSLDDFKRLLSQSDRPTWIGPLEAALRSCNQQNLHQSHINNLHDFIVHNMNRIESWGFVETEDAPALDFDAIAAEELEKSNIIPLFDRLLDHLQKMVDSGLVDSRTALSRLEELIALIRKNMKGSYLSVSSTIFYGRIFAKNIGRKYLASIPGIGPLVEGLSDGLKEIEAENAKVGERIRRRIASRANATLVMPEHAALALPAPAADEHPADDTSDIIDVEFERGKVDRDGKPDQC